MKVNFDALTVLWIAVVVALLIGTVLTVQNFTEFPKQKGWVDAKLSALREIESLAGSTRDIDAARTALEALPSKKSRQLSEIVNAALPSVKSEIERGHLEPALDGWSIRRANIVFEKVPAVGVAQFMDAVYAQRPPWRVVDCSVQALPNAPGMVRATFALEGLERKSL